MTTLLLNVFGGLAIFIFGMKLMSDGLHKVAGEKMRSVLRFFSANRFVAILSGTVVTAVIQSSSASTVMVIGFINAGLLTLVQSIGIIFGANIGTTITAQLVAFDIGWIVMPAIIIGLLLEFVPKNAVQGWGETILGLGFLFLGMIMMSDELKTVSGNPAFISAFSTFDCAPVAGWIPPGPLIGAIGIGMLATLIIQSSSACTGIIIALGASGLINIYTAVALVLGSNIGTTVTAQLAALTANRIAKQAALAHTLFNVIGVLIMVSTFWFRVGESQTPIFFALVNWASGGGDLPRHIANAHTFFNVVTTLILVPFIPAFAHLCEKIIPVAKPKIRFQRLEPLLLDTPAFALSQVAATLKVMFRKAWKLTDAAFCSYGDGNDAMAKREKRLAGKEERIDQFQQEITDYLSQLMRRELIASQANAVPVLIHCTNDAERIADHAETILTQFRELKESKSELSSTAREELSELHALLREQAECGLALLEKRDDAVRARAEKLAGKIVERAREFELNHIRRLSHGKCVPVSSMFYIEMLTEFVKVSHYIDNIVERAQTVQALECGPN